MDTAPAGIKMSDTEGPKLSSSKPRRESNLVTEAPVRSTACEKASDFVRAHCSPLRPRCRVEGCEFAERVGIQVLPRTTPIGKCRNRFTVVLKCLSAPATDLKLP